MIEAIIKAVLYLRSDYKSKMNNASNAQFFLGKIEACDEIIRALEAMNKLRSKK